jgi:hypothetical protein
LTSALVGGEWSALRPCRVTLRVRATGSHWIGVFTLWLGLSNLIKDFVLPYIKAIIKVSYPCKAGRFILLYIYILTYTFSDREGKIKDSEMNGTTWLEFYLLVTYS